jgi:hypothetical protein
MRDEEKQKLEETSAVDDNNSEHLDYDNLWKIVLKRYFWDALKIFLPALHEAADQTRKPEFLEQELQKVTFDLSGGANRTDLLAKVWLKTGDSKLALCHTEVQGEGGGDLPSRMYKYKEAIHLIYDREPVGIVVITGKRPKNEAAFYSSEQFGVKVLYMYINAVVPELEDALLLAEENRVGLVLYAAKCLWKSGNDEAQKLTYLRKISNLWAERGWNPEDKRLILEAIEYLMHFNNKDYMKQFILHLESLVKSLKEEERTMYTSAFEVVYKEQGWAEGLKEGRAKGRVEGHKEGRAKGRVEGLKEGRTEAHKAVARNMLGNGFTIEDVLKCTALPREEVEKLLN